MSEIARGAIAGSKRCSITRQQFSSRDLSRRALGTGGGTNDLVHRKRVTRLFFCCEPDPSTGRSIGTAVFCVPARVFLCIGVWKPVTLPIARLFASLPVFGHPTWVSTLCVSYISYIVCAATLCHKKKECCRIFIITHRLRRLPAWQILLC